MIKFYYNLIPFLEKKLKITFFKLFSQILIGLLCLLSYPKTFTLTKILDQGHFFHNFHKKTLKSPRRVQLFRASQRREVSDVIEEVSFNEERLQRNFFIDEILKGKVQRIFFAAIYFGF